MSAKRELYREGTPENIKKGYTELVYGGENIEVDKGVISGSSGGSGGGEPLIITVTAVEGGYSADVDVNTLQEYVTNHQPIYINYSELNKDILVNSYFLREDLIGVSAADCFPEGSDNVYTGIHVITVSVGIDDENVVAFVDDFTLYASDSNPD